MQQVISPKLSVGAQEVKELGQSILMDEVLVVMSVVYGRTVLPQEAVSWSLDSWMSQHFPVRACLALKRSQIHRPHCKAGLTLPGPPGTSAALQVS